MDGQGFIQKLWSEANSHFSEVEPLAKKDENGAVGVWGAMSDCSHSSKPWEDIGLAEDYTLLALNALMMPKRPKDGRNGQFQAMNIFVQKLKMKIPFGRC